MDTCTAITTTTAFLCTFFLLKPHEGSVKLSRRDLPRQLVAGGHTKGSIGEAGMEVIVSGGHAAVKLILQAGMAIPVRLDLGREKGDHTEEEKTLVISDQIVYMKAISLCV